MDEKTKAQKGPPAGLYDNQASHPYSWGGSLRSQPGSSAGIGSGHKYLSFSTALISARTDLSTGTSHLDQAAFKESTTALQSYP